MKISISCKDKSIVIDGEGVLNLEDWGQAEIPDGIAVIQMDTEVGGHIEWAGRYPHLPITYEQFKIVFYHAMALYDNTKTKILEQELEAKREHAKLEAAALVEAQKKEAEFKDLQSRVTKLEKREEL